MARDYYTRAEVDALFAGFGIANIDGLAEALESLGWTPPAEPAPFPIVGSSGDSPGEPFAASLARINQGVFGGALGAVRTYSGGSIGTWTSGPVGAVMAATDDRTRIVHSFKLWDEKQIGAWLDTKPDDGRQVWVAYHHEPENNTNVLPASTWRARQSRLRRMIDQSGRDDVKLPSILMWWTLNPASGRDWRDWWVPGVFDAQLWDSYNIGYSNGRYAPVGPIIQAMVDVATETGLPWGIAEHGSGTVAKGDRPSEAEYLARTAWLREYFETARGAGMFMMLYWNRVSLSGLIDYRLEAHQSAVDLYRGFAERAVAARG